MAACSLKIFVSLFFVRQSMNGKRTAAMRNIVANYVSLKRFGDHVR